MELLCRFGAVPMSLNRCVCGRESMGKGGAEVCVGCTDGPARVYRTTVPRRRGPKIATKSWP